MCSPILAVPLNSTGGENISQTEPERSWVATPTARRRTHRRQAISVNGCESPRVPRQVLEVPRHVVDRAAMCTHQLFAFDAPPLTRFAGSLSTDTTFQRMQTSETWIKCFALPARGGLVVPTLANQLRGAIRLGRSPDIGSLRASRAIRARAARRGPCDVGAPVTGRPA